MPRDLDFSDHAEVLRRAVQPVLDAMYREGEVLDARVGVADERLIVTITTLDEVDNYDIGWAYSGLIDATELGYGLADRVEEYISETTFAWGEQRSMRGPIPDFGLDE